VKVDIGIKSGNWVEILGGINESSSLKDID
jgi:hypothetical protein